ncbi:MAG: hypothetical protein PHC69_01960 [Ruminiclostridium sp.]|nr:hypothetical protein [Ruminiclostridium sp.]
MITYCNNPHQGYFCSQGCAYRGICPIRTQCPYCPHQQETGNYMNMNPGMYGNANMGMYENTNMGMCGCANMGMHCYDQAYDPMYYQNDMIENYGYDNLYHTANLYPTQIPESYDNIMPAYNKNGYINPNENINSPWDNNRMYAEQNPM